MTKKKFLIAGGNPTQLVWDCPTNLKSQLIKADLGSVEQIGFADKASLSMMGNELCVNATLALASQLGKSGRLKTSGLDNPVEFRNSELTTLDIELPYRKLGNLILFSGIGFICSNSPT